MDFQLANKNNLEQVYELVQETIQVVYPKYYLPEIVEMFSEYHCKDHVLQYIFVASFIHNSLHLLLPYSSLAHSSFPLSAGNH